MLLEPYLACETTLLPPQLMDTFCKGLVKMTLLRIRKCFQKVTSC